MLLAEVCLAIWVAAIDLSMAAVFGGALAHGETLLSRHVQAVQLCQGELASACRLVGNGLQPVMSQTVYAGGYAWTVRSTITRKGVGLARVYVQVDYDSTGSSSGVSMWSWQADANMK